MSFNVVVGSSLKIYKKWSLKEKKLGVVAPFQERLENEREL